MSKGSSVRPTNKSSYDKSYDRIFKKKTPTKSNKKAVKK